MTDTEAGRSSRLELRRKRRRRRRRAAGVLVAVLALLLFNYPFLAVFDVHVLPGGVPLLWAYLFTAWATVIALVAWLSRP